MKVSIETPVFKGKYLRATIDSVLQQTCSDWEYSLFWDGGDDQSRSILEALQRENHPRVHIHFSENRGIAHARRYLTEHSSGEYILPLDDDDQLCPHTVERYLAYVQERPWCGIVRAQRGFIDEAGNDVQQEPWFPFERRHFYRGMVKDLFNHCQPYLIQRAAYERTAGWEGFADFMWAGADCDIYLKLEEVAPVELLDEVLYRYRINRERTSLLLTDAAAFEMWRRLADKTIDRLGLPLDRVSDRPPFTYRQRTRAPLDMQMLEFWLTPSRRETDTARLYAHLQRLGVPEHAIHEVSEDPGSLSESMADAALPLVCLLSANLEPPEPDTIETILLAMDQQRADLAAPKIISATNSEAAGKTNFDENRLPVVLTQKPQDRVGGAPWLPTTMLVARREVCRATRGWDQLWRHPYLRDAEFSLRARARDFKCVCVGSVAAIDNGGESTPAWSSQEAQLFQAKWRDYGELFSSLEVADLSAILSPDLLDKLGPPLG